MNERQLQAKCVKWAKSKGVWCRKVETPAYNGFPDVMCLYSGKALFIEFKSPTGKGRLSPLQINDHKILLEVGFEVSVIDNLDDFKMLIVQELL